MKNALSFALILAAFAGALTLSACNTAEGFGKDVEHAGEKIQETF